MKTVTRTDVILSVTFTFKENEMHKVSEQCKLLRLTIDDSKTQKGDGDKITMVATRNCNDELYKSISDLLGTEVKEPKDAKEE